MDKSQMKNIIVLKDLPSNIVDEAIVILKNDSYIKKKEFTQNKKINKEEENNTNYDFILKEAENVVKNYIKNIEKPKDTIDIRTLKAKYRKLKLSIFFLGITFLIGTIMMLVK